MKDIVPHEINLTAFRRAEGGELLLDDIVETSNRFARRFARRFMRDPQIAAIGTSRPGGPWHLHEVRS